MVAEATAPRRENVPRHILFYGIYPVEGIGVFVFRKMEMPETKTTCFAGGDKALYKKITFPLQ